MSREVDPVFTDAYFLAFRKVLLKTRAGTYLERAKEKHPGLDLTIISGHFYGSFKLPAWQFATQVTDYVQVRGS